MRDGIIVRSYNRRYSVGDSAAIHSGGRINPLWEHVNREKQGKTGALGEPVSGGGDYLGHTIARRLVRAFVEILNSGGVGNPVKSSTCKVASDPIRTMPIYY